MSLKRKTSWVAVLPTLVIPICLGLTMYLGLSYLIEQAILTNDLLIRYTTGHPISRFTTAMFFVGLSSLLLIGKNVFCQFSSESKIELDPVLLGEKLGTAADGTAISPTTDKATRGIAPIAAACQTNLEALPTSVHEHYLWRRFSAIVSHLNRTDSVATAEDELKYLSELDLERQQQRYALIRILIWATPMLGFLGTVLGISEALGGIAVGPENDFESMMNGLRGSLYVAFDTTALALTLSMLLMFGLFLIDRFELQLLSLVDTKAHAEVSRHFDLASPDHSSLQRFSDEFLATSKQAILDQTKIWAHSIHSAEKAWASSLTETNDHVQANLTDALTRNFEALGEQISSTIDKADNAMAHRWQQWQVTLSENCRLLSDHQKQLVSQTENVSQLIAGSSNDKQLEVALSQNQQAIAASQQLQESLGTLASSIEVLQQDLADRVTVSDATPTPPYEQENQIRLYSLSDADPAKDLNATTPADTVHEVELDFYRQTLGELPVASTPNETPSQHVVIPAAPPTSTTPPVSKSDVSFSVSNQIENNAIDSVRHASEKAAKVLSTRRPPSRASA
jgi:hypothetical protein